MFVFWFTERCKLLQIAQITEICQTTRTNVFLNLMKLFCERKRIFDVVEVIFSQESFTNSALNSVLSANCCINCCGASGASERATTQTGLKRIYRRGTNSRIHHFLPECIAFNQSALRHFLSECIAPRGIRGCHDGCHTACHTAEPSSFFARILVVIFCSGLPVKRQEEDRA